MLFTSFKTVGSLDFTRDLTGELVASTQILSPTTKLSLLEGSFFQKIWATEAISTDKSVFKK